MDECLDLSCIETVCYDCDILQVRGCIDKILERYPDYQLTPMQQLYYAIPRIFTREELLEKQKELGIDQLDRVAYNMLYRRNILMEYPTTDIDCTYSLNFYWISLYPQNDTALSIFCDKCREEEQRECTDGDSCMSRTAKAVIGRWRELNPDAVINLWYDSALVTVAALKNTAQSLMEYRVELRDVRGLDIPPYIRQSLHPIANLFYRVDIVKILVADYLMSSKTEQYVVMSDIDVEPMSKSQLFDLFTVELLQEYGYVFINHDLYFENGFSIYSTSDENVRQLHRKHMIDGTESVLEGGVLWMSCESVFKRYHQLRSAMDENTVLADRPRKPVSVPPSQFAITSRIPRSDYRAVSFRLRSDRSIEYHSGPTEKLKTLESWHE